MAKKQQEVAVQKEQLPKHLQNMNMDGGRGSENVTHDDLVVPRIAQAQALSACVKKKDDSYIDGIEVGDMYNNVTRQLYGSEIDICPVSFVKEYIIWQDQKAGGGFFGSYLSEEEAEEALVRIEGVNHDMLEIVDTAQHFCLIVHADGTREEAVFSLSKSKMKTSRQLNSLVRLNGGDRFSRIYRIRSVEDTNNANQEYSNITVSNVGYADEATYRQAESLYEAVGSGSVQADRSEEATSTSASDKF